MIIPEKCDCFLFHRNRIRFINGDGGGMTLKSNWGNIHIFSNCFGAL